MPAFPPLSTQQLRKLAAQPLSPKQQPRRLQQLRLLDVKCQTVKCQTAPQQLGAQL